MIEPSGQNIRKSRISPERLLQIKGILEAAIEEKTKRLEILQERFDALRDSRYISDESLHDVFFETEELSKEMGIIKDRIYRITRILKKFTDSLCPECHGIGHKIGRIDDSFCDECGGDGLKSVSAKVERTPSPYPGLEKKYTG